MSKYREFLTPDETEELDHVIGFQTYHRRKLQQFRKQYCRLIWKGRDRARKASVEAAEVPSMGEGKDGY